MRSETARRLAIAATVGMAALLVLLQYVLTPERRAPAALIWTFIAVWIFGAAMLVARPRFGAAGTVLWGVISAIGAASTHRAPRGAEDVAMIVGSLLAAGLALGTLVLMARERKAAA